MEQEEAKAEFNRQYGGTISAWSAVEDVFCLWFIILTNMKPTMAKKIFYTPKGFNSRAELLKSALDTAHGLNSVGKFLRISIKKAISYNVFRNKSVHGLAVYDMRPSSNTIGQYILADGSDFGTLNSKRERISISDLERYERAFNEFKRILLDLFYQDNPSESFINECISKIQNLPKLDT